MIVSIENKTVLVTGGATGLGLNIVDKFLEHGAKIAIIIDINEKLGTEAVVNLTQKHGSDKVVFLKCDVTSDIEEIFQDINGKYKDVDVLVNNAGVANEKSLKDTININVTALMEWTIKFYDYMRRDKGGNGGTIINVSSIYGLKITPFVPYYHASKFAVVGFTRSLGHEFNFKRTGVRVIVVCPGFTYTQMTADFRPRDDDIVDDLIKEAQSDEWQEVDAVGQGVIDIFEKAESGTVWVIQGSRPATMLKEVDFSLRLL